MWLFEFIYATIIHPRIHYRNSKSFWNKTNISCGIQYRNTFILFDEWSPPCHWTKMNLTFCVTFYVLNWKSKELVNCASEKCETFLKSSFYLPSNRITRFCSSFTAILNHKTIRGEVAEKKDGRNEVAPKWKK